MSQTTTETPRVTAHQISFGRELGIRLPGNMLRKNATAKVAAFERENPEQFAAVRRARDARRLTAMTDHFVAASEARFAGNPDGKQPASRRAIEHAMRLAFRASQKQRGEVLGTLGAGVHARQLSAMIGDLDG